MTKDEEIREYSVKENVFLGAWEAAKMSAELSHIPQSEIMATMIALAEEYDNENPNGTAEDFILYAQSKLKKLAQE